MLWLITAWEYSVRRRPISKDKQFVCVQLPRSSKRGWLGQLAKLANIILFSRPAALFGSYPILWLCDVFEEDVVLSVVWSGWGWGFWAQFVFLRGLTSNAWMRPTSSELHDFAKLSVSGMKGEGVGALDSSSLINRLPKASSALPSQDPLFWGPAWVIRVRSLRRTADLDTTKANKLNDATRDGEDSCARVSGCHHSFLWWSCTRLCTCSRTLLYIVYPCSRT